MREEKENRIYLRQDEPVRFGENGDRAVRLLADGSVEIFEGHGEALVWDAHHPEPSLAFALSRLTLKNVGATPLGVFRDVEHVSYDERMAEQLADDGDLASLVTGGDTWQI